MGRVAYCPGRMNLILKHDNESVLPVMKGLLDE